MTTLEAVPLPGRPVTVTSPWKSFTVLLRSSFAVTVIGNRSPVNCGDAMRAHSK